MTWEERLRQGVSGNVVANVVAEPRNASLRTDMQERLESGQNLHKLWKELRQALGDDAQVYEELAHKGWELQKKAVSHVPSDFEKHPQSNIVMQAAQASQRRRSSVEEPRPAPEVHEEIGPATRKAIEARMKRKLSIQHSQSTMSTISHLSVDPVPLVMDIKRQRVASEIHTL